MLANEEAAIDLHEPKARDTAFHWPRKLHRRARVHALRAQGGVGGIGVVGSERERRETVASLEEVAVVLEPRMLERRGEQLNVRAAENDAVVLRADAVVAARRQ